MTQHLPEVEHVESELDPVLARKAGAAVVRRFGTGEAARELIAMLGIDGAPVRSAERDSHRWPGGLGNAEPAERLRSVGDRLAWKDAAGCLHDPDPEAWWPVGEPETTRTVYAKSVCDWCPVASECGAYAIEHGEQFGIWAGHRLDNKAQRQKLADFHGIDLATRPHAPRPRKNPADLVALAAHANGLRRRGATLAEIAEVAGCSRPTLSTLLAGKVGASAAMGEAILAVTMADIQARRSA